MADSSYHVRRGDASPSGEVLAMGVLIAHQKTNIRLLSSASAIMFILGVAIFIALCLHSAIKELGPVLGNLLTFVSSLFFVFVRPRTSFICKRRAGPRIDAPRLSASQDRENLPQTPAGVSSMQV
jgi:hypothetical protein